MYVKYSVWYEPDKDRYEVLKSRGGAFDEVISFFKTEEEALKDFERIVSNPPRLIRTKSFDIGSK